MSHKTRGGKPTADSIDAPRQTVLVVGAIRFWAKHCWPKAPLALVHLRSPHPHEFRAEAAVRVETADRALAIEDLQSTLSMYLERFRAQGVLALSPQRNADLGTLSCEELALQLAEFVSQHLSPGMSVVRVKVFESPDAGAIVLCD